MNEPTTLPQPAPEQEGTAASRDFPRLRFPFACLLAFWLLTFALKAINKPYFVGFMAGLALAGLITLTFLGWWSFNRRLRLWDKAAGFALMVTGAVLVGKFADHSINAFTLWVAGLPLVASIIVVWLFLARTFQVSRPRFGFVVVVMLGWSYFLLIRTDGADASLKIATHWRWTPTAEQEFLAQGLSHPRSEAMSIPSTANVTPDAADWIAFRGPERDGVIAGSNIATNWAEHPPKLVWKHAVGPAWSSLVVIGQRLYTQEQRGDKEVIVCYDTGKGD